MKTIEVSQLIKVPEGVSVTVNARKVTVKGPRGVLEKEFKHLNVEITLQKKAVKVGVWFGTKKQRACIRTACTHISNMIKGVSKGYQYKLRLVYSHFPINVSVADDKKSLEVRNYIGEKHVRKIPMLEGVNIAAHTVKDEYLVTGNDIEAVSQSAATIQQTFQVRRKDIRKFLDGIYVSERGVKA
jgi:large subunit ribosomal protein L9e